MPEEMDDLKRMNKLIDRSINKITDLRVKEIINKNISRGKQIRPYLYLILKKNTWGRIEEIDIREAAGIEMLHYASLIHDDIIDETSVRRGKKTLSHRLGAHQAVVIGDVIFALALDFFSDSGSYVIKRLSETIMDLSIGQAISYSNRYNYEITKDEYFSTIKLKTASLFKFCASIGASPRKNDELLKFGENFGLYFQLKDDLNDLTGDKNDFEDLRSGEMTLPIIILKQKLDRNKFLNIMKRKDFKEISSIIKEKKIDAEIERLIEQKKEEVYSILKKIRFGDVLLADMKIRGIL
jgi:octaprenyl-diphosphate synthase